MLASHDVRFLKPEQLDALREVASIGAGHAATALSTMTGQTILITVPTTMLAPLEALPSHVVTDPADAVVAVLLDVVGDLTGRTLLLFDLPTACRLADRLMHRARGTATGITPLEQSALMECGNILSGAYLNALAEFMQIVVLPSPPAFAIDAAGTVLGSVFLRGDVGRDVALCVESEFRIRDEEHSLRGHFVLLPDATALQRILAATHLA